ncbi:hypothetical protein [Acinetobacter soli]|uniref:hypothetical protein n=1 Tax=Acinetobacter soli TaxID=487316 RepID=UPI00125CA02B|nr:hypothetical protein [Acinetobacter soli]
MKHKIIESQTKPVLYQHPTQAEQRPSRKQVLVATAKEFLIFVLIAFVIFAVINYCINLSN